MESFVQKQGCGGVHEKLKIFSHRIIAYLFSGSAKALSVVRASSVPRGSSRKYDENDISLIL